MAKGELLLFLLLFLFAFIPITCAVDCVGDYNYPLNDISNCTNITGYLEVCYFLIVHSLDSG